MTQRTHDIAAISLVSFGILSGGLIEKTLIFPLLIVSLIIIYYVYRDNLITVFSNLKK